MKQEEHRTVDDALDADLARWGERGTPRAPDGFVRRVMARLPERRAPSWRERWMALWPREGRWVAPALAGAAAAAVLVFGLYRPAPGPAPGRVTVSFVLHAPDAGRVELLGSFNEWRRGAIQLHGPDGSGHWTAEVELPAGRHEYAFLVDGRTWVVDPRAETLRPDGFGHLNAVLDI